MIVLAFSEKQSVTKIIIIQWKWTDVTPDSVTITIWTKWKIKLYIGTNRNMTEINLKIVYEIVIGWRGYRKLGLGTKGCQRWSTDFNCMLHNIQNKIIYGTSFYNLSKHIKHESLILVFF